jgi:hypothetical protein
MLTCFWGNARLYSHIFWHPRVRLILLFFGGECHVKLKPYGIPMVQFFDQRGGNGTLSVGLLIFSSHILSVPSVCTLYFHQLEKKNQHSYPCQLKVDTLFSPIDSSLLKIKPEFSPLCGMWYRWEQRTNAADELLAQAYFSRTCPHHSPYISP